MHTPLTFRQERFVLEYLKDQNASAAAERAGYTAQNLASQGSELMKNPAVRDRVRIEMQNLLAELRCSALELMKQRMRAAFFRAEKMFGEGGQPLAVEEMEAETRQAVEVRAVLRKSGPVIHVKQPNRDRALRALEKAHERLDRLNEQYYAQLEKAGAVPTLEEIEAMDGGGVAHRIPEKPQVLSGSGASVEKPEPVFSEKPQVLSGSPEPAKKAGGDFSEKPQVLSGRVAAADKSGGNFSEKPQVLSGSASAPPRSKVTRPTRQARQWVERAAKHLGISQAIPDDLVPSMEEIQAALRKREAERELAPV